MTAQRTSEQQFITHVTNVKQHLLKLIEKGEPDKEGRGYVVSVLSTALTEILSLEGQLEDCQESYNDALRGLGR